MQGTIQVPMLDNENLALSNSPPFPFSYKSFCLETGLRPIGFRFSKFITNIVADLNGTEINVCGESSDHDTALNKAISELLERSALCIYGPKYNNTISNGWAAHPNQEESKLNSIMELVERDAVLAQWYSKTPFIQIEKGSFPIAIQEWEKLELARSEFPFLKLLISTKGLGPSITCLLMNKDGFGVSAHSTRISLEDAIASSIAEACRAAHAAIRKEHWKDTLILKNHDAGNVNPSAHALYYAYHEPFPSWIFGDFESFETINAKWNENINHCLEDKQFNYQQVMSIPTHVGFARHPQALNLYWKTTDSNTVAQENGIQRLNLKPESINDNTHIVS